MTLRHVALIPDGNRRWARARGLPVGAGHLAGIDNAGPRVAQLWSMGVEVVSLWWGSPANLQRRSPEEVEAICGALSGWLEEQAPGLLGGSAALELIGRWPELCPQLGPAVDRARAAAGRGPRRLVILMAYDGRDEILAAAEGGPEGLASRLWTAHLPPVDLVLRSGGEAHLSAGFMLWQIAEARLAFSPTLWPELGEAELAQILAEADARTRRYGR
jgi:undecaprenyl diphosphate synthase